MKKEGTIVRWDDERGFGFIRSPASTADVFLHVRDFRSSAGSPREGMRVTFEEIHVGGKGPRAVAVQPAGQAAAPAVRQKPAAPRRPTVRSRDDSGPSSGAVVVLPLMVAYTGLLAWAVWTRQIPWWVLGVSALINFMTFMAYWFDKYAAQQKRWRTAEDTLHFWSLAGGWGGAWLAQQVLRHKSRKASFRATYFGTVLVHCAVVAAWFWYRSK